MNTPSLVQHHSRNFRDMKYVYPVVSRRSGGLSLGVNLSPTARCNFSCAYCQVLGCQVLGEPGGRRAGASETVDLARLETELAALVGMALDGSLFDDDWFARTPPDKRALRDIAFSGDGEPTLSPQFPAAVDLVAKIRAEYCPEGVKTVLITNATTLHVPAVRDALRVLVAANGEIWAKLDAGTPEYYRTVSRSAIPYEKILAGLTSAATEFPLVVQTCLFALDGVPTPTDELRAYAGRVKALLDAGGHVRRIQLYTTARRTPEPGVTPLENAALDGAAKIVREITGLPVDAFYSS